MKMMDMFDILGETLQDLHVEAADTPAFKHAVQKAEFEAKLAKQLVNAADVVLRTDKMTGRNDRIDKVVGS